MLYLQGNPVYMMLVVADMFLNITEKILCLCNMPQWVLLKDILTHYQDILFLMQTHFDLNLVNITAHCFNRESKVLVIFLVYVHVFSHTTTM